MPRERPLIAHQIAHTHAHSTANRPLHAPAHTAHQTFQGYPHAQRQPGMAQPAQHAHFAMPSRGGSRGFQSFQPPPPRAPLVNLASLEGVADGEELRRQEQEVGECFLV